MRSPVLAFCLIAGFSVASLAASLEPHLTAKEHETYPQMMKTNPRAAQRYLDTRNYVSLSRQVVANRKLAIYLVPEPDSYNGKYVTKSEQKIVDHAIILNIAAMISGIRRH